MPHVHTSIREALQEAVVRLRAAGLFSPHLDAELLLAELLGRDRAYLFAHADDELPPDLLIRYQAWVARRARGEPLAYILGYTWFYGLRLRVTPDVLVPRPETEVLVDVALVDLRERGGEYLRVADVGTGSGAIAVALARHEPRARVVATDVSARALRVAAINVAEHQVADRVHVVQADLLTPLVGPFDLIAANLPYVGEDEQDVLAPEVRAYEPAVALWAGKDGLVLIRRLLDQAPARLRAGGTLLLEVGYRQAEAVERLARRHFPHAIVTRHRDLAGHERIIRIRQL